MEATDSDESVLRNSYGGDELKAKESLEKYVKTCLQRQSAGKIRHFGT